MEGYHNVYISRYYPDTFDYMGLFSPALNNNPQGHPSATVYQNLEEDLIQQKEHGCELYWIAVEVHDMPILYKIIQDYRNELDRTGMKYVYKETDGGHTWSNWR